jgi:ATP-binding cassette subfamily F protein uup
VLVTHDRFLLDRVATILLTLDATGHGVFFADYAQWEASRNSIAPETPSPTPKPSSRESRRTPQLSSREKQELAGMEKQILAAEEMLVARQQALDDPAVASDPAAVQERYEALTAARAAVDALYARWAELEEKL